MPVVISPSLVENTPDTPLTHARIGYDTFVRDADITASSEATGFPASSVALSMTYERWQPTSLPATLEVDAGEAVNADYIGIASHTLGSEGATVELESSTDGSAWESIETIEPSDDDAIMVLFEPVQARYWRLTITGGNEPQLGVLYIGEALAMQRRIYGGHTPGKLSRNTTIEPNGSEGGQYLGRSVIRRGYSTSYAWSNLTAQWYRDNFDPFVEAAIRNPFFIAWYPSKFPSEVLYAWTSGDIAPSNQGTRDLMDVSFSVEGLA